MHIEAYNRLKKNLNKPVVWSLGVNFVSLTIGTLVIISIGYYFDMAKQGVYFTFTSLAMLQFCAEFGLGQTIIQLTKHYTHTPSDYSKFKQAIFIWFKLTSIILTLVLLTIPLLVNFELSESESYIAEWYFYSFSVVINYFYSKEFYLYQGENRMLQYWRFRFLQFTGYSVILLTLITLDYGITALVIANFVSMMVNLIYLKINKSSFGIVQEESYKTIYDFWRKELYLLQLKIGITWLGNNIVNRFITPIIFATNSAVLAGKYGMSLSLASICFSVATIMINIKIPTLSQLAAKGDNLKFESLFKRGFLQGVVAFGIIVIFETLALFILDYLDYFDKERLLEQKSLILLVCIYLIFTVVSFISNYMRCYRVDNIAFYSLCANLTLLIFSTYILKKFEFQSFMFFYFAVIFLQLILSYISFHKFRLKLNSD